ncbi:hypothetical protein FGO68_gene17545 [Halteria grandinella]|uniref:Uncharacterized protein n=1 Tax=Halteria grandinella TaxID=5974 RepID=A0A8J8NTR8_HALGN|nr:hypothetical protein FGO68_gene17545 [Halteria grandinella]
MYSSRVLPQKLKSNGNSPRQSNSKSTIPRAQTSTPPYDIFLFVLLRDFLRCEVQSSSNFIREMGIHTDASHCPEISKLSKAASDFANNEDVLRLHITVAKAFIMQFCQGQAHMSDPVESNFLWDVVLKSKHLFAKIAAICMLEHDAVSSSHILWKREVVDVAYDEWMVRDSQEFQLSDIVSVFVQIVENLHSESIFGRVILNEEGFAVCSLAKKPYQLVAVYNLRSGFYHIILFSIFQYQSYQQISQYKPPNQMPQN